MGDINDVCGELPPVIYFESDEVTLTNDVLKQAEDYLHQSETTVYVLGDTCGEERITVAEHFIWLYRRHCLHKNEREMVLSSTDQIIAMQLCLAEKNKQVLGDFDVDTSTVVEINEKLMRDKLSLEESVNLDSDEEYQKAVTLYRGYLSVSNLIDHMDVYNRIKTELAQNQPLQQDIKKASFILVNRANTVVEKAMMSLLVDGKRILTAVVETSLDESTVAGNVTFVETSLQKINAEQTEPSTKPPIASISELYVEQVVLSYLHLLVNSRCEIALARVINVPNRDLDHKAFTAIKRESKNRKNMSLYQTIVSYILRLRLGGRSYAPDPSSTLAIHVKGLGEFTDLTQKLQNIIEECSDPSSGVRRVLNVIKNTVLQSRDNTIRRQSVETVIERLQQKAVTIINHTQQSNEESPKRTASDGGSQLGRKTLRTIRGILDHASGQPPQNHCVDVLTDAYSSQKTPIRFQCLMSKFRSPVEYSPEPKLNQTLAERLKTKVKKQEKVGWPKRYQSCMDWAPLDSHLKPDDLIETTITTDCLTSKTVVQSGCESKPRKGLAKKVLESINDEENLVVGEQPTETSTVCKQTTAQKGTKRLPSLQNCPAPPSKKAKVDAPKPTKPSKTKKKKQRPLQKGQKTLTAFFRI